MTRSIEVSAFYEKTPDEMFALARNLGDLARVMAGLATYEGLPTAPVSMGEIHKFRITFADGRIVPEHQIEVAELDETARRILFREKNPDVPRWDHELIITAEGDGALWTDRLVIDAGHQTDLAADMAVLIYQHRHSVRGAATITPAPAPAPAQ